MAVLCDIRMPKLDGIEAKRSITAQFPKTKVIAFAMLEEEKAMVQMLAAKAAGCSLQYFVNVFEF